MTVEPNDDEFVNFEIERGTLSAKVASYATGIEARVCRDIADRQARGIAKYGTTVQDNPLNTLQWLQHMYEELLDGAVYAKRCMAEIEKNIAEQEALDGSVSATKDELMALLPQIEMWMKADYQGIAAVVQLRNLITKLPSSPKGQS